MSSKRVLYIVRHGKSSWDYDEISDIDRPLKYRGIRDAYEMARRLKIARNIPGAFITSPANRAMHTATIFLTVFEKAYDALKIDTRIYEGGRNEILQLIREQPAEIKKLAIFGHNPVFSDLSNMFAKQQVFNLPTSGMGVFTFECDSWGDLGPDKVVNEFIDFPKKE